MTVKGINIYYEIWLVTERKQESWNVLLEQK